jgi:hypothetical protein
LQEVRKILGFCKVGDLKYLVSWYNRQCENILQK